jgi:glycerol-3-phosphate cytidylyltransferase-like family protein
MVRACKFADVVLEGSPLVMDATFLDTHKITCVVHGDDSTQSDFFAEPIRRGIMQYLPYTPGISTSEIIQRITSRSDEFQVASA